MTWKAGVVALFIGLMLIIPVSAVEQNSRADSSFDDGPGGYSNSIWGWTEQWMVRHRIEICDGRDNDHDKQIDEGDPGGGFPCYTGKKGVCAAGTTHCVNGKIVCVQNVEKSPDTQCDRLDQDCDGKVDEDYVPREVSCGTGVCTATGQTSCHHGVEKTHCKPGKPSKEICDGLDNDCDGSIDDGIASVPTSCGSGECRSNGENTCIDGKMTDSCIPRDPSPEVCDGIDNDCNEIVDDGIGSITCGVGECTRTVPACSPNQPQTCIPGEPSPEICDTKDNDCNGSADDGLAVTITCGVGECSRTGERACTDGQTVETCTPGEPSPEICDTKDNDCNGSADDELTVTITCGFGECSRTGESVCTDGQTVETCTPGEPSPEICDGKDNDCDEVVDEDLGTTTCGVGECTRTVNNCVDGKEEKCKAGDPSVEVCDNKDNDCDGTVDNGFPELGTYCQTGIPGICGDGTYECSPAGGTTCVQDNQPTQETCNHLDDDCDGTEDEASDACSILNEECIDGTGGYICSCPGPHFLSCGDACVPINTDNNCGGCGTEFECTYGKHCFNTGTDTQPDYRCDFAYCANTNEVDCIEPVGDGVGCTAISTTTDCGGCGFQCDEGLVCRDQGEQYGCEVPCSRPYEKMCGDICTDISTNENCGDCGVTCELGETCTDTIFGYMCM